MNMSKKHMKHEAYKHGSMLPAEFESYIMRHEQSADLFAFVRTKYSHAYNEGIEQSCIKMINRR